MVLHLPQYDRTEAQIVDEFVLAYSKRAFYTSQDYDAETYNASFYREVTIPYISRRSDVIMKIKTNTLINIEFKLTNWESVYHQAWDHLRWADYSYVCMPDYAMSFTPTGFHKNLLNEGIGLLLYANNTFTHAFKAYHNSYKDKKEKRIRTAVEAILETKKTI